MEPIKVRVAVRGIAEEDSLLIASPFKPVAPEETFA